MNLRNHDWSYRVKESKRARKASIRMKVFTGIEVTVPVGYDRSHIPAFLDDNAEWIVQRMEDARTIRESLRPDTIQLRALDTTWQVSYIKTPGKKLELQEASPGQLVVKGAIDDPARVTRLLNTWVRRIAKSSLIPWLERESKRLSLPYSKATIRHQKTRWGSCSTNGSINLNQNLLFLDPREAEYVLQHELCHTKEPNHSKKFWDLLTSIRPDAISVRKGLRYRDLPDWIRSPFL